MAQTTATVRAIRRRLPWVGRPFGTATGSIVVGAGGLVAGGTATPTLAFTLSGSGGTVLGGSATASLGVSLSGSGGAVLGGTAQASTVFTCSCAGGAVLGGSALVPGTFTAFAAGGAVVGGTAQGFVPGATWITYVDPTAFTVLPESVDSDVDPTQVTIIQ